MKVSSMAGGVVAACLFAWLACLAPGASAASSYIADPGEAARAVDSIIAEAGESRLFNVQLTDRSVSVQLRGPAPTDVDQWQIGHVRRLFFEFETTVGPRPYQSPGLVSDTAAGFFDRGDIALERVSEIAARAIAYAKLKDEAHVQSIEIARQVDILPEAAFGEVRWSIYVTTGRESAKIRADAAGNIIGGDLSNTDRARNMDLLSDADWPRQEAMDAIAGIVGDSRRLRNLTVRSHALSFTVDHPTVAGHKEDYNWTISGVTRSPLLSPLAHGAGSDELFGLEDVDLSGLGRVRDAARNAWGGDARLDYMMLRRTVDVPGPPELRWVVYFSKPGAEGGAGGTVEVTPDGKVAQVSRPVSDLEDQDWLAPSSVAATLARIGSDFRPGARFAELTFDSSKLRVLAEAPERPGAMAEFLADATGITRSDDLMPWDEAFRPGRLFALDAAAVFVKDGRLADFRDRTYRRLGVDGNTMPVSRYTFGIGQLMGPDGIYMVPSPDGRLTLEVRVESPDGQKNGRVTYASSGDEIDVVLPR